MTAIPIILEQYECVGCNLKWYINTQDKVENEMECPYGCECTGGITRKFDMTINNYDEYVGETNTDDKVLNKEGGKT